MQREATAELQEQMRLVASLRRAEPYPHPVSSIEVLETHISWVILTGDFAYKIKKAVTLDFLDFSTLERRLYFCEEELRLNKQWAPELYLEIVPVAGSIDRPKVAAEGAAIEFAVKMRQFPQSAQLDKQLRAGLLREQDMYELAEAVARYQGEARVIEFADDRESVNKVRVPMLENFLPLQRAIDMNLLSRVRQWTADSLAELKPTLVQRRKDGFVRECHGDLHLANLVRLSRGIVPFDCVEFSPDLRNIDVLSDIAFLVMDLVAAARQDLAYAFLNRYLECTGDYEGMRVFGLYFVYHCMIRAKVAAIRGNERRNAEDRRHDIENLKHNLAVAIRWIETPPPRLIAMHGFSASGKTWLSSKLMTQLPAIRVRSDVERKRLFDVQESASSHSPPGRGIYTEGSSAEVYKRLMRAAGRLLVSRFNVIIDATFLKGADRRAFIALAEGHNVNYAFVDVRADRQELERRLQRRAALGKDVSEADTTILRHQFDTADALTSPEQRRTIAVNTEEQTEIAQLIKSLKSLDQ
jgi:aminoglycoside phosphotransferase family enzyme/predicted kinase